MLLVSIIMPVFNGEKYLSAAIESVLLQTFREFEFIILDDGSTDASLRIIQEFQRRDSRIRVISRENRGHVKTLNELLGYVQGEYVGFNAHDDNSPPERLSRQVAWLRANPEYAAVCGSFSTIDGDGRLLTDMQSGMEPADVTDELRSGKLRTHICTFVVRTETMIKVGGFREYFESAEDIDLQFRLAEAGRIGYVPETFYFYRLHSSSITHTLNTHRREFFDRVALDFQKQRRTSGTDDLQRGCPPSKPETGLTPANAASAHIQGMLLGRAWREHGAGDKAKALGTGLRALTANPSDVKVWKSLVALALKPAGGKPD